MFRYSAFLYMVLLNKLCILSFQQLQQQNLSMPQFVLVQSGHPIATPLQPAQVIISQTPQAQQSTYIACNFEICPK